MGAPTFLTYAAKSYDIDFTMEEAKDNRAIFFDDHNGLPKWYKRVERVGAKQGYVESLSGRRRNLPNLKLDPDSSKEARKAFQDAVRMAVNSPVQGFGSGDLKLMGIIGIRREFRKRGWDKLGVRLLGEIHDSVIAMAPDHLIKEVATLMVQILRHPPLLDELEITIDVPIEAEAEIGQSLGSGVEFKVAA